MRKYLALLTVPLLSLSVAAHAEDKAETSGVEANQEARLQRALEGWEVSGEPVKCIQQRDIRSTTIFPRTAILYDTGQTRYLNRPASGAQFLRSSATLVTDTRSSQLCDIDIVRLYDSGSRMTMGSVGLGQFIPYKRVQKEDATQGEVAPAVEPQAAPEDTPEAAAEPAPEL